MIQANELRIGNYVWDDYGGTMIIDLITNDYVDCKKSSNLPSGRFDLSSIKYISIDGNWLTKLGFEKLKHSNEWYVIMIYGTELSVHLSGYEICFGNGQNFIKGDFKHIHKIQNLYFALTNKELTLCQ